jgi:NADPH-dependent 2,4-dienoyl-CoA reductase/sulfur reductase-like enzyme
VHTCWTLADARAIAALAKPGARVLQLGAGFIGCIIMEALVKRGVQLTVVEMGDRMVPRMMTPEAGGMIKRWVEQQGVRVVTQAGVDRIEHGTSAALRATLTTGERLECDLLIVAAGVAPNVAFLEGTAVHIAKGVLVAPRCRPRCPEFTLPAMWPKLLICFPAVIWSPPSSPTPPIRRGLRRLTWPGSRRE